MSQVALLLAEGFEEIEAVAVIDILRRAKVDLKILALKDRLVKGAHGLQIQADGFLEQAAKEDYQMVILPGGGPGVENLKKDTRVAELLEKQLGQNRLVAAICAAPTVLAQYGMLKDRNVTGFPGTEDKLRQAHARVTGARVVVDDNLITSRGPGTAIDFALELVTALKGAAVSEDIRKALAG